MAFDPEVFGPEKQDLLRVLQNGAPFSSSTFAVTGQAQEKAESLKSMLSTVSSIPGAENIEGLDTFSTLLDKYNSSAGSLASHVNGQFSSLPVLMSKAQVGMDIMESMGTTVNPCLDVGEMFGSAMGMVNEFIKPATDAIAYVYDLVSNAANLVIGTLVAAITAATEAISSAIKEIASAIDKELGLSDKFDKLLNDFAGANMLGDLVNNPCLKGIFKNVASPEIMSAVRNIPGAPTDL